MGNSFIDLIIRIKNGYLARKEKVEVLSSNFNLRILKKLKELKYIKDYSEKEDGKKN